MWFSCVSIFTKIKNDEKKVRRSTVKKSLGKDGSRHEESNQINLMREEKQFMAPVNALQDSIISQFKFDPYRARDKVYYNEHLPVNLSSMLDVIKTLFHDSQTTERDDATTEKCNKNNVCA